MQTDTAKTVNHIDGPSRNTQFFPTTTNQSLQASIPASCCKKLNPSHGLKPAVDHAQLGRYKFKLQSLNK